MMISDKISVLVYDSQEGYFSLIKNNISNNLIEIFDFNNSQPGKPYSVLIFLIHDILEITDFIKLYKKDIPVIFGSTINKPWAGNNNINQDNIYWLDLNRHRDKIINDIQSIFNDIANYDNR